MVKGCGHKMSRQLIKSMPCKISKLLLTADIDVIRASHHDIKRYEGEKDSSDDQKRERERERERVAMVKGWTVAVKKNKTSINKVHAMQNE